MSVFYSFFLVQMKYEIKTLNGITCIFAPMQESNSITIQIWVKAGAIYETSEEAGISHFLEHMFFKWGKKWTTPKAVATAMDKIWAEFNARTGQHRTAYYIKSAPHFATQWLELLADMLIDAQFPQAELERERWASSPSRWYVETFFLLKRKLWKTNYWVRGNNQQL